MSEQVGAIYDWGLPLGQMVESEAFTLEHSLSLTENLQRLASLTDKLDALKNILSDQTRTESQRVKDALKTIIEEPSSTSLSKIEEEKCEKLAEMIECQEVIEGQPTTKIDLSSQDELRSSGGREKTRDQKPQQKQCVEGFGNEDMVQLRYLVRAQKQELIQLQKEKAEIEAYYQKQVAQLTRKLQVSQEKITGCCCKSDKGQEIGKMNKWLETLNKLLYGAQRQAAMSREELKRSGQVSAKQLREKDNQIKMLEAQLQSQRNIPKCQIQS